jgi:hypothetical protein
MFHMPKVNDNKIQDFEKYLSYFLLFLFNGLNSLQVHILGFGT